MKKITSLLLCMVLVLSMFCVNAAAAEPACMEAGATVAQDGTVTVVVSAKQTAANAHLTVDFSSDYLTYVDCETDFAVCSVKEEEEKLTIGLASATANAAEAGEALVKLIFRATGRWDKTDLTITAENYGGKQVNETLTVTAVGPGYRFVDVRVGHWFFEAVDYMASEGYIKGYSETHFAPDVDLSRAMMITILYRIEGCPEVTGTHAFQDVPAGTYYTEAVIWATQNGITNGVSTTAFDPHAPVTREQMAAMLCRYEKSKGVDVSVSDPMAVLSQFPDGENVSRWAVDSMAWAVDRGIINGKDGMLAAAESSNRAQVVVMLHRYLLNQ